MNKRQILRWLFIVVFLIGSILATMYALEIDLTKYGLPKNDILKYLDWGGIASLLATIVIGLILKVDKSIYDNVKDHSYKDNFWRIVILALALAGLFGIWLAIRTFGLHFKKYLTQTKTPFAYSPSQTFLGISFILTANLSFTLLRTLVRLGKRELPEKAELSKQDQRKEETIPELIQVAIQAVIIGLITLLPRYGDPELLSVIGFGDYYRGVLAYVTIFLAMIVALVLLVFARKKA